MGRGACIRGALPNCATGSATAPRPAESRRRVSRSRTGSERPSRSKGNGQLQRYTVDRSKFDIVSAEGEAVLSFLHLSRESEWIDEKRREHDVFLSLYRDGEFSGQVQSSTYL